MRLVAQGCYSRNFFSLYSITPRSYDDFLRQLRFFIPEENISVTWHDKRAYFSFTGNTARCTENYLHTSFLLKSLLPDHCLHFITLLQILNHAESPLTFSEIEEIATAALEDYQPELLYSNTDLNQLLRRRLSELVESGLVRRAKIGNSLCYEKISNPLGELSPQEVFALITAVNFYKNHSLVAMPAYFLRESLSETYPTSQKFTEIFQLKNNHFARILDDEILFTATQAINANVKLYIEREGKPSIKITPISIETDYVYNRQYLIAGLNNGESVKLRVDKIIKAKLTAESVDNFCDTTEKLKGFNLRVHFQNLQERHFREKILAEYFSYEIIEEGEKFFVCKVYVEDPLKYYPELWKFQTWAEILQGKDKLRERIKNDVDEALKNYDESF